MVICTWGVGAYGLVDSYLKEKVPLSLSSSSLGFRV